MENSGQLAPPPRLSLGEVPPLGLTGGLDDIHQYDSSLQDAGIFALGDAVDKLGDLDSKLDALFREDSIQSGIQKEQSSVQRQFSYLSSSDSYDAQATVVSLEPTGRTTVEQSTQQDSRSEINKLLAERTFPRGSHRLEVAAEVGDWSQAKTLPLVLPSHTSRRSTLIDYDNLNPDIGQLEVDVGGISMDYMHDYMIDNQQSDRKPKLSEARATGRSLWDSTQDQNVKFSVPDRKNFVNDRKSAPSDRKLTTPTQNNRIQMKDAFGRDFTCGDIPEYGEVSRLKNGPVPMKRVAVDNARNVMTGEPGYASHNRRRSSGSLRPGCLSDSSEEEPIPVLQVNHTEKISKDISSKAPYPLKHEPRLSSGSTMDVSVQDAYGMDTDRKESIPLVPKHTLDTFQSDESHQQEEEGCLPCVKKSKKNKSARPRNGAKGKRSCLTAHLAASGLNNALPELKSMVASYSKMLTEDRAQFLETMFRAVKLNNLGVTKILCKIVQKNGLRLSSFPLREPESSATILHVALLYNNESIVRMLLELKDRELILAKYESSEYRNQTALHLAVANENPGLIERILLSLEPHDRVLLINTTANGRYFKDQHPNGQLCLTAAAWAGNVEVIKTLVRYGGQLSLKNSFGNTLLHTIVLQSTESHMKAKCEKLIQCVWEACNIQAEQRTLLYEGIHQNQREIMQERLQEELFRDLLQIRNNNGFTPLVLSVTSGSSLFKSLINMEKIFKIPQNKLGSIAWVTYDVTDIASFAKEKYNKFSVLHILAHKSQHLATEISEGDDEEEEDILEMEPIKSIVNLKWRKVYRWAYIFWFAVHLLYMMLFTACTAATNSRPFLNSTRFGHITNAASLNLLQRQQNAAEIKHWLLIFAILPGLYMLLECIDIGGITPYKIQFMKNQNIVRRLIRCVNSEWSITGNGPYRLVSFGFSSFTLQWYILYYQRDDLQDIALAMSLLLGWIFLLFFTRACRFTCRFSIMIQKMFFQDLLYFLAVYGIILLSFSFAISALFTFMGDPDITINKVFYDMMNVVTDLDTKQSVDKVRHPMFAKLMLILYAIVAVILLMNMLIAMMNTSYEAVRITRCNLWKQQQLSIMLMMERRFYWLRPLCSYSECDVWQKQVSGDNFRSFMDVTMVGRP